MVLGEQRKRRRRSRRRRRNIRNRRIIRRKLLVALAITGILSVSIIELAAHAKQVKNQNQFTNIVIETAEYNGLGSIKPVIKDKQKNEEIDKEDNELVKPTKTIKEESGETKNEEGRNQDSEKDNFSDAVFIGDSRTEGLQINTGLTTARFLSAKGLKVDTALKDSVIKLKNGSKGTVIDGLKEGNYKRVYVMFGMNELGWPYLDVFTKRYEALIDEIKKVQPNATIYVQSILPVTKEKSDNDSFYNNKNIRKFNKAIKAMAKKDGYTYLDVASAVKNSKSALPSNASTDGVHLNKEYSQKWLDYLREVK